MFKIIQSTIIFLLLGCVSASVSAAEWELSGDMALNHQWHNAIKLNDGRVLVTGSWIWDSASNTTEVYDPATGSWTVVGNVTASRASLTLLADGRVLLAGGELPDFWSGGVPTNSSYLFDPITNTWSQTGYLNSNHARHSAVLLPNGRVLIAGGVGSGKLTEIYDPATGYWSYGPSMNYVHSSGNLVSLPNGKALIAGSGDYEFDLDYTANAEVYNPTTNSWQIINSLNIPRGVHKAVTLTDGRVMVMGGFNNNNTSQNTAESYNPVVGNWTLTGSMSLGSIEFSATTLANGMVLVTGGASANGIKAEVYHPESNTWELSGDMPIARRRHSGTLLDNGKVLIAGGMPTIENITSVLYTYSGTTTPPPVIPPEPVTTHIASLSGIGVKTGKRYWQAIATITAEDDLGNPVANAMIIGHWDSRVSGQTTCTTNSEGVCEMTTDKTKNYNVIYYVDNISHDGLAYDSSDNVKKYISIVRPN